jgi:hypothetical protein
MKMSASCPTLPAFSLCIQKDILVFYRTIKTDKAAPQILIASRTRE